MVLAAVFVAAVIAVVVFTTISTGQYRCEVCMSFEGRTACKTVRAASREQAEQMAIQNVCGEISSGMTSSMQCQATRPDSIRWLQ